jgi:hypothetical protein
MCKMETMTTVQPSTEAEFLAALEQAGMRIAKMGAEWEPLMNTDPRMSAAEVREMLAGVSPLSEVIIAERNEGR